jgi:hypothetical protein
MAAEEWDKPWVTDFTETDGRNAKRRFTKSSEARYQDLPQDVKEKLFATRVRELNFLTYCRYTPNYTLRYIAGLSKDQWMELKQKFSDEIQPPDEFGRNARDCLPEPLGSLFEAEYEREMGRPIKKEKRARRKRAGVIKAVEEVSGPDTELAKLDKAFKRAETTPADVNSFGAPVAGYPHKHRKAIASDATFEGKPGQAAGKEVELLARLAEFSERYNTLLEHNAKITEQLKRSGESFEELGRQLQSCVDSLTPAQASAPESAGS